jgi:polysaccharide deacetylase family protein (PEP-CTERM system associated)
VIPRPALERANPGSRSHLLTIGLEDYFQVDTFDSMVARSHWYRFESRLQHGLRHTFELLDEVAEAQPAQGRSSATFFVLGWIAERFPELVRSIAERGHEIASSGFEHRRLSSFTPDEFQDDLARTREALERAVRQRIHGHRVSGWMPERHRWALDVLARAGYSYDSSLRPLRRARARDDWRRMAHEHRVGDKMIWEYPVSTIRVAGVLVPAAGGNFLRQLPEQWVQRAVARWEERTDAPFVFYFQTWELDPDQPRLHHAPLAARVRHYRNLGRMRERLARLLGRHRFSSIAEWHGLSPVDRRRSVRQAELRTVTLGGGAGPDAAPVTRRLPVTVVIPCYNEAPVLGYLANTLASVEGALQRQYDLRFLFVDDGSSDGTYEALLRLTSGRSNCRVLRQPVNGGVARAIQAGVVAAETDVVASIDCDCTYDPHELAHMIPLLADGVVLVTASPYHPLGSVQGVPRWRLGASRILSWMYRVVLRHKLHTYTSCFRVYRRSVVADIALQRGDFLGVAELVARIDAATPIGQRRIVEFPTTLSVRVVGRSKMRMLRIAAAHLGLLASAVFRRGLRRERIAEGVPAANGATNA